MALRVTACLPGDAGKNGCCDLSSQKVHRRESSGRRVLVARTVGDEIRQSRPVIGAHLVLLQLPKSSSTLSRGRSALSLKSYFEGSDGLVSQGTPRGIRHACRAGKTGGDGVNKNESKDENENLRDEYGRDKYGLDEEGLDKYGLPGDAIFFDGSSRDPEYHTYIDPNTGEPAPTYGVRPPLPNAAFWGGDLSQVQKPTRASPPADSSQLSERASRPIVESSRSSARISPPVEMPKTTSDNALRVGDGTRRRGRPPGARRKKNASSSPSTAEDSTDDVLYPEELRNRAQLRDLTDKFPAEEQDGDSTPVTQTTRSREGEELRQVVEKLAGEGEEPGEEDNSLGKVLADKGYALVRSDASSAQLGPEGKPLSNDELWWNWKKPPADEKPWSAWQKRAGDSDTVMAAAMAETGQIKLFGERPTICEATLARARKRVFYDERMAAEEERKNEIGAMAYYKEWVKAYKEDTSKEAVQKRFEETGEEVGLQLIDMFEHQTQREYRKMQGTDIRIRRDPLVMRLRPDQIKQVWGGDPVYPTINYVQDPDAVADYRNANMHEPIPDILELLRESGRLLTQAELKELLELEKTQELEFDEDDRLTGAVDIGEDDEGENDDDEDEEQEIRTFTSPVPNKSPSAKLTISELDGEVEDVREVSDDIFTEEDES